jgi:hypothetical protein
MTICAGLWPIGPGYGPPFVLEDNLECSQLVHAHDLLSIFFHSSFSSAGTKKQLKNSTKKLNAELIFFSLTGL